MKDSRAFFQIIFSFTLQIALLLSIAVVSTQKSVASHVFDITKINESSILAPDIEYLNDPSHQLTIDQILDERESQHNWATIVGDAINFGYTQDTYWFRFTVENPSEKTVNRLIEISAPLIDYLDFFIVDRISDLGTPPYSNIKTFNLGDKKPFQSSSVCCSTCLIITFLCFSNSLSL